MKVLKSLLILFASLALKLNAQEVQVIDTTKWLCTYNYEFLQDSTSKYSLKQIQMVLQVGNHSSVFCDLFNFIGDSLLYYNQNTDGAVFANIMSTSLSGINTNQLVSYSVYKNYPKKAFSFFKAYANQKYFKVVEPMQMKWKLEASKDTEITSYRCKKASTTFAGRRYLAWYTAEIPVGDGPYKFNGLPGLIVKISDIRNEHQFTLTSIKKLKYIRPITISKQNYIEIKPQEYVTVLRNNLNKLSGKVVSGEVKMNEEAKAKSLQGLKAKNNFIEKY